MDFPLCYTLLPHNISIRGDDMVEQRKYYEAYDERYKVVHEKSIRWFGDESSAIVAETIDKFGVTKSHHILEVGCGEGRDAHPLLTNGYHLLATDISPAAIDYCRKLMPDFAQHFQVLDCVQGRLEETFDFICAVAVVHMLVTDEDRNAFYRFIHHHLKPDGIALICTMGDGEIERQSDIHTAFDLQEREHEGEILRIASTSCRMVNFPTFEQELRQNDLCILDKGLTSIPSVFSSMMYAVVKRT